MPRRVVPWPPRRVARPGFFAAGGQQVQELAELDGVAVDVTALFEDTEE